MDFRTKVPVAKGFPKIKHKDAIFLIGSCFVENIGAKLDWFKYSNLQNPTGIIFHPSPIRRFFQRLSTHDDFMEKDVFEFNEGWQSLEAHSSMRRDTRDECLKVLNDSLKNSREVLSRASHVIISLGTSWGYIYDGTEDIVANCHKIPQAKFKKEISSVNEIVNDLEVISHTVSQMNDRARIIFTVSPVRHLKDGVVENQQSKAHLISAIHQFLKEDTSAVYFPSYEILMDELRDYRFYEADMLHPSSVAVNYIWQLFSHNWISEESLVLNAEIDKIQRALSHRSRAENTTGYKKFLTKLQGKIEEIQKKHPEIIFSQALLLLGLSII